MIAPESKVVAVWSYEWKRGMHSPLVIQSRASKWRTGTSAPLRMHDTKARADEGLLYIWV